MIYTLQRGNHVRASVRADSIYRALRLIYDILTTDYYEFALRQQLPSATKPRECRILALKRASRVIRGCEIKTYADNTDIGTINHQGNKGYDHVVERVDINRGMSMDA